MHRIGVADHGDDPIFGDPGMRVPLQVDPGGVLVSFQIARRGKQRREGLFGW